MSYRYPKEVHSYIAENVKGIRPAELAEMVNERFKTEFTKGKMGSYMKNHNLKNGLPTKIKGDGEYLYSKEVKEFINKNYVGIGHSDMADQVNKIFGTNYTGQQIKSYYGRYKLDSGLTGQYAKGHTPFNKGKPKYWIGGEESQFKKGHTPANHREVGSERVSVYGYVEIKVAEPNKWKLKHVVVWEEHSGPVPKGSCVLFGDSDKGNLNIDNLLCVSRKQLVRLNQSGLIQKDINLTKSGIVIADIQSRIGEIRKRK